MAKPNYAFEKRQKELAKKQKQQEKQQQKVAAKSDRSHEDVVSPAVPGTGGRSA